MSNVNQLRKASPVPGAVRSGYTSSSTPWPLVAGSYHEPVRPCWFKSGDASAARTAAEASRIPAPQVDVLHDEPAGNGLALDFNSARTSAASRSGATASISATTPLT